MKTTIIVPTVKGREEHFERCLDSYERTTPGEYEFIVVRDKPTCGVAWNEGLEKATGDLIHITADDLIAHEGWWQAGTRTLAQGFLPEARILNEDGTLHSCGFDAAERADGEHAAFSRIPFFHRNLVRSIYPVFNGHYATDVWISECARMDGVETVICRDYLFTHTWAQPGRMDNRLERDLRACGVEFRKRKLGK